MPAEAIQVSVTTGSREMAGDIARSLVESRLAACVQVVGPVSSTYRWEGSVHEDAEWLCLIKTTRARFEQVVAGITALHDYDLPEAIAMPVVAGSGPYLDWLQAQVSPA